MLLPDRTLMIFVACAVLFHFANAAMLPLLGEMLAKGKGARLDDVHVGLRGDDAIHDHDPRGVGRPRRAPVGRKAPPADRVRRAADPIRGVLYTLTGSASALGAIQLLDGIGAGIFGVVSVLVIADLTRGTGAST